MLVLAELAVVAQGRPLAVPVLVVGELPVAVLGVQVALSMTGQGFSWPTRRLPEYSSGSQYWLNCLWLARPLSQQVFDRPVY